MRRSRSSPRPDRRNRVPGRAGLDAQLGRTLVTVNEAVFVCTWILSVFFLLAAGPLAFTAGRRALGWSAIGIALVTLVATALSFNNFGQMSGMFWLAWTVYASVRSPAESARHARSVAASTVQHA